VTLSIALLVIGLALILADIVLPTLGVLAFLGAAALLWAVGAAFAEGPETGMTFLVVVAIVVPTVVGLAFKFFPRSPVGRRVVSGGLSFEATAATDARDLVLVGQEGEATSFLRPAGHARIAGRRVDVVSRGEPIEAGTRVRVVEVRGNRVVVVPVAPTEVVTPGLETPNSPPL
jgi:membrane-bound ClpP family serine protease